MASTYSPKLRLELIGAGEQAGLWGTTTNKNLGQLIEQAIAGVTTVELDGVSGNYTLTALDGAPDQSRSAVIKCTYAAVPASGVVNLVIPTQTKLYVVRNDCGQIIYVKTSAQVGGVEIKDGESTLVFCDGTNAIPGIQTAAVGTLTVSGGGTGATTFTAGFVKSPGGTGALTSSSTVNLATETTGTLATTNGGTGITGFTAANNAIYSTSSSALTAGTLPVAAGGTGAATLTANSVLIGNGTSAVLGVAPGSSGNILTSNGTTWTSSTPAAAFTTGMIILWSGSIASIPSGWVLCNGLNGTPDLRDKFIVGAGSTYAVNATGGATSVTLATTNLPSHTHSFSATSNTGLTDISHTHSFSATSGGQSQTHTHSISVSDPGHSHVYPGTATNYNNTGGTQANQAWRSPDIGTTSTQSSTTGISASAGSNSVDHTHSVSGTTGSGGGSHSHSFTASGTTGSAGSGTSFSILPPYYALAYIMKT